MSYVGYITQLKELRPHTNADRLQVGTIFGSNVIVSLDYKEGDVVIFFPSDGQLSEEFCKANNLIRILDENGNNIGGYLDENKRNITAIKLRGEKSDGLALPLSSLSSFGDISTLKVGDAIDIFNGALICNKYIPKKQNSQKNVNFEKLKSHKKKKVFVFFEEHIDTAQLAYNKHQFNVGDICYITLKLHGTSGRTSYTVEESETKKSFLDKILRRKSKTIRKWNIVSGTRRTILDFESDNKGFYGTNDFRKKWHDIIASKLKIGETVYYELVGSHTKGSWIMPQGKNKLTNDKDFIKQYGDTTTFSYGCEDGESELYIYRMTLTNEYGNIIEYPQDLIKFRCEQMGLKMVPEFDRFVYTTEEDLMERVYKYCDGVDPIGKTHIREGVVVRIEGHEKFKAFKHKNFYFKCIEGIIKSNAIEADMEEVQDENI